MNNTESGDVLTTQADAPTKADCLRLIVGILPPYVRYEPPVLNFYGTAFGLVDLIAERLGFCYTYFMEPHNHFGLKQPNGSWTGIMGILIRGEAEFTVSPLAITYERYKDVDFTNYVVMDDHAIAYKYPTIDPDVAGFTKPFMITVWVMVFLFSGLMMLAMWLTTLATEHLIDQQEQRNLSDAAWWKRFFVTFRKATFLTIRPLLGQGLTEEMPIQLSLLGVWMLMTLILGSVYKGNLMSMLIAPSIHIPFGNFEELISQNELPYKMATGSYFYDTAQNSPPDSLLGRVLAGSSGTESNVFKAARAILGGEYAYINIRNAFLAGLHRGVTRFGRCTMAIAPGTVLQTGMGWGFKRNSLWKNKIDWIIKSLHRFGIMHKIMVRDATRNATQCLNPVRNERGKHQLRALVVEDFLGVFSLFAGGIAMGIAVFLVELCIRIKLNRKQKFTDVHQQPTNNAPLEINHT